MSGPDLYLSQRTLALLFVYAAMTGFGLGGVYDGLRVLRMALGGMSVPGGQRRSLFGGVLLFVEDVLFTLAISVALLLLCYYANDGQFRAPALVGLAGGMFVYFHTVSPWLLRLTEAILGLLRWLCRTCLMMLAVPVKGLWSLTVGRLVLRHRVRQTEKRIRALTEAACRGFDVLGEEQNKGDPPA